MGMFATPDVKEKAFLMKKKKKKLHVKSGKKSLKELKLLSEKRVIQIYVKLGK